MSTPTYPGFEPPATPQTPLPAAPDGSQSPGYAPPPVSPPTGGYAPAPGYPPASGTAPTYGSTPAPAVTPSYGATPNYGASQPPQPQYAVSGPAPTFATPWTPQQQPQFRAVLDSPALKKSASLGRWSLIFGLIASVLVPILAAIGTVPLVAPFNDAVQAGRDPFTDFRWLTNVAGWELLVELSVYLGTAAGLIAIVAGIMAIAQRRGRRGGVWGMILGIVGIVVCAIAMAIAAVIGIAMLPDVTG